MTTIWTRRAIGELHDIRTYIARDNPRAAADLVDRLIDLAETMLPDQPNLGRPGRVSGTRELFARPAYILVYRVSAGRIEILAVRHAARLWPEAF